MPGELVAPRDREALGNAIARAASFEYDPHDVAGLGARGGWTESAARLHDVLRDATGNGVGPVASAWRSRSSAFASLPKNQ